MDINKIVGAYIRLRDEKSEITRAYEAQIATLTEMQDRLSAAILGECKALNVESIRTDKGTAFRTVKEKLWVSDWAAVEQFILDNNALDLLEHRLAQSAAKDWAANNPDKPIPSLVVDRKYAITIRRGK